MEIVVAIVIVMVTLLVAYLSNRALLRLIRRANEDLKTDPTNYKFLRHLILALIYLIGFSFAIYSVPTIRDLAKPLLAGTGILAVAVGFASQHALSNVISGMFIVIFKPFRINDRLALRTYEGIVEDITLRHTVIRNFESKRIIIPNAVISDEIIINADFAEDKICKWLDLTISYESSIDLAKTIVDDEVRSHPFYIDPRTVADLENNVALVVVRVTSLGESAVNLRAWAWGKDASHCFQMSCDLYESIKKRFDKEGIVIPYPQRTVHVKNVDGNV